MSEPQEAPKGPDLVADGGLDLSRPLASLVILGFIVLCLLTLPQRAGQHPEAKA